MALALVAGLVKLFVLFQKGARSRSAFCFAFLIFLRVFACFLFVRARERTAGVLLARRDERAMVGEVRDVNKSRENHTSFISSHTKKSPLK